MGLDIYFHKTHIPFEGDATETKDFRNFTEKVDEAAQQRLQQFVDKNIKPLEEAYEKKQTNQYWEQIYNERYFEFVMKLRKEIATNYDFRIYPYTRAILDLPELKEKLAKEVEMAYEDYNAYFRKVNFIFCYYENTLGKMIDQCYALTDADDIDRLIDRCERVLKDHSLADTLLPTQEGFFFGGTDYDEWYFYDVKNCLKQMKKFRKGLDDGMTAYVIFSW